eukprot:TRINITY_DN9219_c0_g1_i1.p4 TRINITY_DN9219_c0_g1~~TRINITY_DN9219_c0_g1_i1.p4  ORF type:complete len:112 (+),score=20.32 TRINITY_DN9219_c0_g1_i1:1054-1389(+)
MIAVLTVSTAALLAGCCGLLFYFARWRETELAGLTDSNLVTRGVGKPEAAHPDLAPGGTALPQGPPEKAVAVLSNPLFSNFGAAVPPSAALHTEYDRGFADGRADAVPVGD